MALEGLFKQPPTNFRASVVYAYIAIDPEDGNEGVLGIITSSGVLAPAIAFDEARLAELRPLAEAVAQQHPGIVKLVKFSNREDLEVIMKGVN